MSGETTTQNARQDVLDLPFGGRPLLLYAKQDPMWKKIPSGRSKKAAECSESKDYQCKLMQGAEHLKQLYAAFYTKREQDAPETVPEWSLDFENEDCLVALFRYALVLKACERLVATVDNFGYAQCVPDWEADHTMEMRYGPPGVFDSVQDIPGGR